MNKKRTKRVDSRKAIVGEQAAKWRRFSQTGAPFSLIMLALFVGAASVIMTFGTSGQAAESTEGWFSVRALITFLALMGVLSAAMGLYVAAYEPRIISNYLRGATLLLVLLVMISLVSVGLRRNWPEYFSVVPVMVTAVTMTIAYSQRFALGLGAYLALASALLAPEQQFGLGMLLVTGSGMGIAVLALKEIRTRSRLVEVCLVAAVVVFGMIWVVGLWYGANLHETLIGSLWGAGGAVLVGFLMQGLLPLIERLFRTATNMTLLDFGEQSKPLLKRLALEAPGTFNHSWQIGMLAEAAAEGIGANGLLCRVGSYYHDVGKLGKPRYFVENQADSFSQHKELEPTMSRMIIIGHVKDGLELARQYRLPKVLHQFIETHHGTTLVEYFFHEAAKREAAAGRSAVEAEFRYPGPKPATAEAAIVMLTDAVEGATRAMQEPTPSRIENLVHNMAMKRLQDGQFDECDLTMRQLQLIEASLTKSLCAMYHARIAYPTQDRLIKAQSAGV